MRLFGNRYYSDDDDDDHVDDMTATKFESALAAAVKQVAVRLPVWVCGSVYDGEMAWPNSETLPQVVGPKKGALQKKQD